MSLCLKCIQNHLDLLIVLVNHLLKIEKDTNYIYRNDLDKACFKHDMAYGRYKDLKQLNSIEALISQALVDLEISHGEFKTIVYEKEKYDRMKESIRNIKSTDKEDEFLDFDIFLDIF